MKNTGSNIKAARKAKGLTQTQLGDKCGASKAAVAMWESGKSHPSSAKYTPLANALDVSVEWLLSGKDVQSLSDHAQTPFDPNPISMLPIIGSVQAGVFQAAIQDDGDWERIPFQTPSGYNPKDFYILRVVGDSMDQFYPDGSRIVCVKIGAYNGTLVEGRHIIVERRDQYSDGAEATVKELVHDTKNAQWLLMPKSSNPQHRPIPIPNGDGDILDFAGRDDLKITGVVYAKYEINRNF